MLSVTKTQTTLACLGITFLSGTIRSVFVSQIRFQLSDWSGGELLILQNCWPAILNPGTRKIPKCFVRMSKRVKNLPTCASLPANIITIFARILPLEVFDPCLWTAWGARPRQICIWVHPPGRSDGKLAGSAHFLPLIGRGNSPSPQTNPYKLLFHWKPLWLFF